MSVNGITNAGLADTYSAYSSTAKKTDEKTDTDSKNTAAGGAVYEPSDKNTKKYQKDPALIAKLKADADARTSQFRTLVEQMMSKQGASIGNANDMWRFLAGGNLKVSPEVQAQAKADIAEDGYWGVTQTSDRIVDFAKALTGGDPAQAEKMREAFEKGFKQATKTWGGKLPDISQRTYESVMGKLDKWAEETSSK